MDAQPTGAWRWRYFIAYGATVAAALVPLLLGKIDGPTYANALTWLFGALVGGGAAADATKRKVRGRPVTGDSSGVTGAGDGVSVAPNPERAK